MRITGPQDRAALAALVAWPHDVLSTSRLTEAVWGCQPPASSPKMLQNLVLHLRKVLGGELIETGPGGYRLRADDDAIDAVCFEQFIDGGRRRAAEGDWSAAVDALTRAVALWRGVPLPELSEWDPARGEVARLQELHDRAQEELVEAQLVRGRHHECVPALEMMVSEEPLRERRWALLMLALYRAGRQAAALRAFQRSRARLAEIGLEPGPELVALERAIASGDPSLAVTAHGLAVSLPDGTLRVVESHDQHSTCDQAPLTGRPPARSGKVRSNLPPAHTALIGRDHDISALTAALEDASVVTVTGAAGIGKTQAALHAAAAVGELAFPGGVWVAWLAPLAPSDRVADIVLSAVEGRRQHELSVSEALSERAGSRRMLVVLDNCEHVVDAAAMCAESIVASGVSAVLATSREPLGVVGEQVYQLPGLADDDAVTLFTQRARAVDGRLRVDDADRAAIASLCRRLDGMPLAIELAAARLRSMTIPEVIDGLQDRFRLLRTKNRRVVERHRTLQAAVVWSYDLLDSAQKEMFTRLSVFAGGFGADAVVAVTGDASSERFDVIDALDVLVARSMLVADRTRAATRYSLLETLREFGKHILVETGAYDARRAAHARYFLVLAEAARRQLSSRDATAAMTIFEDEWDNLRLAFEWFAAANDRDAVNRLLVAMYWFAEFTHRYELLPWAEQAIALEGARSDPLWPAAAGVTALLRWGVGDMAGAEDIATEACAIEEANGWERRLEPALALLQVYQDSGRGDDSKAALPVALAIAERRGDPLDVTVPRVRRITIELVSGGDFDACRRWADEDLRAAQATQNPHQLAGAYTALLAVASMSGDLARASDAYHRARRYAEIATNRLVISNTPLWLAYAAREAEPLEAIRLVRDVLVAFDEDSFWATLDFALVDLLLPLIELNRPHAAALALGAILNPIAWPGTEKTTARARAALAQTLGPALDEAIRQGQTLERSELVRTLVETIDALLLNGEASADE